MPKILLVRFFSGHEKFGKKIFCVLYLVAVFERYKEKYVIAVTNLFFNVFL